MCGITGAVWSDPELAVDRPTLDRMTEVLRHRGPDDSGVYTARCRSGRPGGLGVALGHRRLSIVDVAGGHQPMASEDGSIRLVFNGEVYNYPSLRKRLEGTGHVFRTHCDAEAVVHLFEDEGVDCFSRINGMFAAAVWDETRQRLVLARDRMGQKPLVYRHESGRLLFASELKSLLEVPGVSREIDPNALDEYLTYQYVPPPNTIFRGIRKLPPGHWAVFENGKLAVRPYWSPDWSAKSGQSERELSERLRELLESSVAMRLQSDVPLGAFLSGGVDSSLVAALMRKAGTSRVKTFSIGFPVPEYDETSHARHVAAVLETDHHEFQVTPDAVDVLPKLVWHFDEPFGDSSAVPTWYLSQLTREHVTVALTGDGGDELFAGYDRYRGMAMAAVADRLPGFLRKPATARFWQRLPGGSRRTSAVRRLKRFSEVLGMPPERRYFELVSIFNESRRAELYSDGLLGQLADSDPFEFLHAAWSRAGSRSVVTQASTADLTTYLPCDLMAKVDIASMAHGLECRQPFLDYRVVELAMRIPAHLKTTLRRGKRILRRTFGPMIPRSIWNRRKMGFGVPLDHWFRDELRDVAHDVLLGSRSYCRDLFRPEAVRQLVEEHESRRFDHSYRLWALLILEMWLGQWAVPANRQNAADKERSTSDNVF